MDIGETVTFRTRDGWRRWLAKHHDNKKEVWLVYYKKSSGKTGVSYDASVEEALAYGWIDGLTKSVDEHSYASRFTPRKPKSNWSPSNIARVKKLLEEGRMAEPGLATLPSVISLPPSRGSARART
ncbi:MAG: hypothetical protein E6I68_01325 [Chloroflexi bacterium]|nr:MAG: hypothetical protein E6I68_01325 [Chloroflexota bacterium]